LSILLRLFYPFLNRSALDATRNLRKQILFN